MEVSVRRGSTVRTKPVNCAFRALLLSTQTPDIVFPIQFLALS